MTLLCAAMHVSDQEPLYNYIAGIFQGLNFQGLANFFSLKFL